MVELVISKPRFDGRKLLQSVSGPNMLMKYIKEDQLFIEYDCETQVDESILSIPLTAAILPLAWLTGSDVVVDSLDRRFKESMDELKETFRTMFPKVSYETEIIVDELVDNENHNLVDGRRTGLLFSGGLDSTYTLYHNLDLKPKLVSIWGVDNFAYPGHADHWIRSIELHREFAEKYDLEYYLVKTNVSQILDDPRIEHKYHKDLYNGDLRGTLSHSLVLLPPVAPLSMNRFDNLLIAASNSRLNRGRDPSGALPIFDEKIVWADLDVEHHGVLLRLNKIRELADFLNRGDLSLRVCWRSSLVDGYINCGVCEKCLRTIVCMVVEGIDPNVCGFHVTESTWDAMKKMVIEHKSKGLYPTWKRIHELSREGIKHEFHGSNGFFEWYKDFDFKSVEKKWFWTDMYNGLPYSAARLLEKILHLFDVNIIKTAYVRELSLEQQSIEKHLIGEELTHIVHK